MLWSICCYFNPCHYKTKYSNYRLFREHLKTPLCTIELAYTDTHELQEGDADLLLQIQGQDILWQKERLLNLALSQLPSDCHAVAWLDADIIFSSSDRLNIASQLLDRYALVQPFSHLLDLPQHVALGAAEDLVPQRNSVAWGLETYGLSAQDLSVLGSSQKYRLCPGQAWVARRDLLEKHGFYDALILGSGDKFMCLAALGEIESTIKANGMNVFQADHYRTWARGFFTDAQGKVGYVPGLLIHLWHGDLTNRLYSQRHREFARFNFNPYKDIRLADNGCWAWNSAKPEMHQYVAAYFGRRFEDGVGRGSDLAKSDSVN